MDMTVEEARALVSDQALWPRMRDFLWDFAPQVHPSWVEDLLSRKGAEGGEAVLREMKSPRVKRFVLESLGVKACFHAFPKEDGSRILLLDGDTLVSVANWLGAIACADDLRRIADGKSVRALKAALPGIYPEVFGYTMYFNLSSGSCNAEAQGAQRITEEGCKMLFSVLSKLPGPLVRRMELKFPKGLCDPSLSAPMREINYAVVLKLLRLKFPEAYSLCC